MGGLTPYSFEPAFIRCIQSDRMSRFLVRRSRYAYWSDFSRRSRAMRMQFLPRVRNPLASARTLSLCMVAVPVPPKQLYLNDSAKCAIQSTRNVYKPAVGSPLEERWKQTGALPLTTQGRLPIA